MGAFCTRPLARVVHWSERFSDKEEAEGSIPSTRTSTSFMAIRFTKHALEKFTVLQKHGVFITKQKVLDTVTNPELVDTQSRAPLIVSQSTLDQTRVLRVVYRQEVEIIVIITFYPGRKSQYAKQ